MQGIFNHEKSGYKYKIIDFKQNNGQTVQKYQYVNRNGNPVMDKGKHIYINKNTGEIITGNGKKYVVNRLTKQLAITPNGYIIEEKNNKNFSGLPRRMASLSIAPTNQQNSQQAPAGMMRDIKGLPPGGFIGNRKPNSNAFVPKGSIQSYSGSMFTSGPAPPSTLVPTVLGKNMLPKKSFIPGFKT